MRAVELRSASVSQSALGNATMGTYAEMRERIETFSNKNGWESFILWTLSTEFRTAASSSRSSNVKGISVDGLII